MTWGHVTWGWSAIAVIKATWSGIVVIAVAIVITVVVVLRYLAIVAVIAVIAVVTGVTWLVKAAWLDGVTLVDAIIVEVAWSGGDRTEALNGWGLFNYW